MLVALLKELEVKKGKMNVVGNISYSSQVPWLFYGTLRDNILFGEDYDENKYNKVVSVCSLLTVSIKKCKRTYLNLK